MEGLGGTLDGNLEWSGGRVGGIVDGSLEGLRYAIGVRLRTYRPCVTPLPTNWSNTVEALDF